MFEDVDGAKEVGRGGVRKKRKRARKTSSIVARRDDPAPSGAQGSKATRQPRYYIALSPAPRQE